MNSLTTSKEIGTIIVYNIRKNYKPGQLLTINNRLFRVMKKPLGAHCCEGCYFSKYRFGINDACDRFCHFLPGNCKFVLNEKSIKHKG